MIDTMVIALYILHNFFSMRLYFCDWLQRFFFVNPLPFVLNIVINDPFFVNCNDILEKQLISLIWNKTCHCEYVIDLISLINSKRNSNIHFFKSFSSGDRLWIGMYWDQIWFSITFVKITFHKSSESVLIEIWWIS